MFSPLAALLLLALPQESAPDRTLVDRIVAVVNEDVITLSELEAAERPFVSMNETPERRKRLREDALEQLIAEKLLAEQTREAKIEITDDEVDRAIEDIVKQNKISKDQLQQAVEARGMSMSQYRHDLEKQLVRLKLVDLKVRSKVAVAESDIRQEYERISGKAAREELISIRHLFFRWAEDVTPTDKKKVLEKALAARKRVVGGEDFAAVAKAVSDGPTASTGGDLGEMGSDGLLPELARALRDIKEGEISPPIETGNGIHVVRVEGRRLKPLKSFDDMRSEIYQRMYQEEVERQMKLWVTELKGQAVIDVRL